MPSVDYLLQLWNAGVEQSRIEYERLLAEIERHELSGEPLPLDACPYCEGPIPPERWRVHCGAHACVRAHERERYRLRQLDAGRVVRRRELSDAS